MISVIMPTRNAGHSVAASLESILNQNFSPLECLVMDGGSRDNTVEIAESFQKHGLADVRVRSEPDAGIYDAMNQGIRHARGRYLYFVGAGDRLRPGILTELIDSLDGDEPDIAYGRVYLEATRKISRGATTPRDLARFNICHQGIFYRRDLFERVGDFDTAFPVFADYEFNLRCFGRDDVRHRFVDLIVADYQGGGTSDLGDARFEQQRESLIGRHLGPAVLVDYLQWHRGRDACLRAVRRTVASGGTWAVYGAGSAGAGLLSNRAFDGLLDSMACLIDSDPAKWGKMQCGFRIRPPTAETLATVDSIVIASAWHQEIRSLLVAAHFPVNSIFKW